MKVILPSALKQYADNQSSIELPGATVAEVLDALTQRYPNLRKHIFSDDGRIRAFVNVYVNEDDIRHLERREGTALTSKDVISIIPSIAGGSFAIAGESFSRSEDGSSSALAGKSFFVTAGRSFAMAGESFPAIAEGSFDPTLLYPNLRSSE